MSTIIYYFTGTGNSLNCARNIGNLLGDTRLVPMQAAGEETIYPEADSIGLVLMLR